MTCHSKVPLFAGGLVGLGYLEMQGDPPNVAAARRVYEAAAAMGNAEAHFNLGAIYGGALSLQNRRRAASINFCHITSESHPWSWKRAQQNLAKLSSCTAPQEPLLECRRIL